MCESSNKIYPKSTPIFVLHFPFLSTCATGCLNHAVIWLQWPQLQTGEVSCFDMLRAHAWASVHVSEERGQHRFLPMTSRALWPRLIPQSLWHTDLVLLGLQWRMCYSSPLQSTPITIIIALFMYYINYFRFLQRTSYAVTNCRL